MYTDLLNGCKKNKSEVILIENGNENGRKKNNFVRFRCNLNRSV